MSEKELQIAKDLSCGMAAEAGLEAFEETEAGMAGYVQTNNFDRDALDNIVQSIPVENIAVSYDVEEAEDKDWNKEWEDKGFEPIRIEGKLVIHDAVHPFQEDINKAVQEITIDAKQAFGTGCHETTFMIVSELANMGLQGESVLDCGCGTGILSIAASKLGAKEIVAYDIDEWSVKNTRHNCKINGVKNVSVLHGDVSAIHALERGFDVVVANINRNILLSDMPSFWSKMNNNSVLIMSGFYDNDAKAIIDKATSLGLKEEKIATKNSWCMVRLRSLQAQSVPKGMKQQA